MLSVNAITEKINEKVGNLQNYRQIFMDLSTPEKLRSFRHELINFFFEIEREIKMASQLINTLASENKNLNEKAESQEKNAGDLYFENLSLKEKLLKEENKIADLANTNKYLELQLNKKDDELGRIKYCQT
jgi:DNA repair exonuclease SbcCD ATPase subunit